MVLIYDLLFMMFSLFYLPYLLLKKKWHKDLWTRFGFLKKEQFELKDKRRIWIHAVSVGEVMVVKNLLPKIREAYPEYQIIVSTVTQTGFQTARSIVLDGEQVIYAPVDLSFSVSRHLDVIQPSLYLNTETELWPNLLTALKKRLIPVVQINGRISDKAFAGYKALKWFVRPLLENIDCFCMQSQTDAERITALGAPSKKVFVTGNIKFDDDFSDQGKPLPQAILNKKGMMFVAGSTHPGEEEIILDALRSLRKEFPSLSLVLAPRHPDRAGEIVGLCEQKGFSAVKFSAMEEALEMQDVIVVDTIGHLRSLYPLADIVFLGKSLTVKGGHNVIEPAFYGKPVIVGPFMQNFRDVTRLFVDGEALVQINGQGELKNALAKLLSDGSLRDRLGANARKVIEQNRGATEKTFAMVAKVMGS